MIQEIPIRNAVLDDNVKARENAKICKPVYCSIFKYFQQLFVFSFVLVTKQSLPSRKLLRIKVTRDLHLTYSKNWGNLGLVLKMKNIACLSILLTKHVKYTYLYLFKFILYSSVAFRAN